jgi:hypothetical protein
MIGDGKLGATKDTIDGVDAREKTRMTLLKDRLHSICICKRYFSGRACIELGARILFVLSFAPTGTSGFDRETKNACVRLIYELFPGQPLGLIDTFLEASYAWNNRRGTTAGKRILYGAQFAEQDTKLLNEELQLCSDAGMTIVTMGAVACAALLAAAEGQCNDVVGQSIITKFRPDTNAYHITTGVAPQSALQNMTCDEYLVALSMNLSTTPCPPSQSPPARPVPNTKYRALGVVEWTEKDAAYRLYLAKQVAFGLGNAKDYLPDGKADWKEPDCELKDADKDMVCVVAMEKPVLVMENKLPREQGETKQALACTGYQGGSL